MSTATLEQPKPAAHSVESQESLYEVVNGQRVELPPMGAYSTWLASCLHGHMWPLVKAKDSGTVVQEMLFILDADRDLRRRPDVAFVSADRWPLDRALPETGDWLVVPNLAVEVVSPNDLVADLAAKIREYFHYGVEQLWVILPSERKVYVYDSPTQVRILGAEEDLEGERLLPGFRLALSTLFQKPASVAESTSK